MAKEVTVAFGDVNHVLNLTRGITSFVSGDAEATVLDS